MAEAIPEHQNAPVPPFRIVYVADRASGSNGHSRHLVCGVSTLYRFLPISKWGKSCSSENRSPQGSTRCTLRLAVVRSALVRPDRRRCRTWRTPRLAGYAVGEFALLENESDAPRQHGARRSAEPPSVNAASNQRRASPNRPRSSQYQASAWTNSACPTPSSRRTPGSRRLPWIPAFAGMTG
jgi:hypothetical protein